MTDEELEKEAKEYSNKEYTHSKVAIEEAYIAGAKAHISQWHNLRKNPNDLPKENELVLIKLPVSTTLPCNYVLGCYDGQNWISKYIFKNIPKNIIVAWCELPKFEE